MSGLIVVFAVFALTLGISMGAYWGRDLSGEKYTMGLITAFFLACDIAVLISMLVADEFDKGLIASAIILTCLIAIFFMITIRMTTVSIEIMKIDHETRKGYEVGMEKGFEFAQQVFDSITIPKTVPVILFTCSICGNEYDEVSLADAENSICNNCLYSNKT